MGTIQGESAKRQAGVGAKREGSRCQGERQSKKHPLRDAPPSPWYMPEKENHQAQGQPSSPLLTGPASHFIYRNTKNSEQKEAIPLAFCSSSLPTIEPLVLVFILPNFNPSLGEEVH